MKRRLYTHRITKREQKAVDVLYKPTPVKMDARHCSKPDRDNAKLTCGYPLPCPFHTVIISV